jgi:hypothetical protein
MTKAMNSMVLKLGWIGLMLMLSAGAAKAAEAIATIKTLKGEVSVVRGTTTVPAKAGMRLEVADKLVTEAGSAVGIAMQDATLISLGAKSATQLNEFRYDPVSRDGNMLVSVLKGSMRFVTGLLGKHDPKAVGIRTPTATIGIRGTDFIVSVEDKE